MGLCNFFCVFVGSFCSNWSHLAATDGPREWALGGKCITISVFVEGEPRIYGSIRCHSQRP
jgi:hypothetical protein